ncbi:MAG TPA: hypothetical protein VF704_04680 [Allosphingosinicella sp.]|jgi:hypothetical protein
MTQRRLRLTILIAALFAAANPLVAGWLDAGSHGRNPVAALFWTGEGR